MPQGAPVDLKMEAYPPRDGKTAFPFRRVFVVAF
jgi:trans-aconitate methyltransferase